MSRLPHQLQSGNVTYTDLTTVPIPSLPETRSLAVSLTGSFTIYI